MKKCTNCSRKPEAVWADHIINRPVRVALEETEEGAHKGLRIDAENGETTLLRFRSPAFPETVDGVILR
jgi:hypothetical protein